MKTLASNHPEVSFFVATVDNVDANMYSEILKLPNVMPFEGETYDLLSSARAAVVTSGTATLETALFHVPQVVIYRANVVTYAIGSRLVKVPFISLVNLIAEAPVVEELLQGGLREESLNQAFLKIWKNGAYRRDMISSYQKIHKTLSVGKASENAARLMVEDLKLGHS
jgi:lipid-A-disaccharide synthase